MIRRSDISPIGRIFKTHGVKGEMSVALEVEPAALRCIVLDIDGIYVPFFIESSRSRGAESWLIKIDGLDTADQAATLTNKIIYGIAAELPGDDYADDSDEVALEDLIGFDLYDGDNLVGKIDDIDDSTDNILFIVDTADNRSVYIPFSDELLVDYDLDTRCITLDLPQGLLDLN